MKRDKHFQRCKNAKYGAFYFSVKAGYKSL